LASDHPGGDGVFRGSTRVPLETDSLGDSPDEEQRAHLLFRKARRFYSI
jgi:hypothetical protein